MSGLMKLKFDDSFARRDHTMRARHGKPWTPLDYQGLHDLFMAGHSLQELCEALQRPADGVIAKLESRGYIRYCPISGSRFYLKTPGAQSTTQELPAGKEEPMNKTIETKVLINGKDSVDVSDRQIFAEIARLEQEIAKLQSIKAKSVKLAAAIAEMQADIDKLVEFVDAR